MKGIIYRILKFLTLKKALSPDKVMVKPVTSIYDIPLLDIHGKETSLKPYKGKKILIVNTASECGYTPQYAQLQELHEEMGGKIAVLGFPCNDFGGQEPAGESQIEQFCSVNYGVSFPLFSKVVIKGDHRHPLYRWLTDPAQNGWNSEAPSWNFCKYLVSENGELLHYLSSAVDPFDSKITG